MADDKTATLEKAPLPGGNVELDTEGLVATTAESDASPSPEGAHADAEAPGSKVELDLDDAPFLMDEPEEAPAPVEGSGAPVEMPEPEDSPKLTLVQKVKKLLKNKKILFGGIGGIVVIIALLFFLLGRGDKPETTPPPPPPAAAHKEPEHKEEAPPIPPERLIKWEPFWIEQADSEGKTRFLICEFAAPTKNPAIKQEAEIKTLVLRDAIYYYLSHKPLTFLSSQQNADALKADLLAVINGYLTQGQLDQLLIENYLIK